VTLGFFDPAKKQYKPIFIEEHVELLSLVANIARNDEGDAKLHAHVVVGKADGTAHGGHLLEALVRPTMQILVVESSEHLRRRMRDDVARRFWIFPCDRVLRLRTRVRSLRRPRDTLLGMPGLRSADEVPSPESRRASCCP
jgi:hypothetical protein